MLGETAASLCVAAGSYPSAFRKSPCTRKDSRQDLSADKGPLHTVFSHVPEPDPSDTVLGSIEAVLIPQMLLRIRHDSLRLTEVSMGSLQEWHCPCILFPSTLTCFRRCDADAFRRTACRHWESRSRSAVSQIRPFFCACFLGFLCGSGFFTFWPIPRNIAFSQSRLPEPTYGTLSFICPFLYTNTMLTSILQGLGKPGLSLIHSIAGILIRIFLRCFHQFRHTGIRGYLYGIFLRVSLLALLLHYTTRKSLKYITFLSTIGQ